MVACMPDIPAQATSVTFVEHITQRFLIERESLMEKDALYRFLVGIDAAAVLTSVRPSAATAAKMGSLLVQGDLLLSARLDPYDPERYSVMGFGGFEVFNPPVTEPPGASRPSPELIFDAHFEIGGTDMHDVSDLPRGRVILPISHSARLNPSLLVGPPQAGGGCSITTFVSGHEKVPCNAPGVGTPYPATYFVQIHLREIEHGAVYAIARDEQHEIFRLDPANKVRVFGCLDLGEDKYFPDLFDLRGREHVKKLADGVSPLAPRASYDHWDVPDTCNRPAS
jgi:hypothetical protein